MAQLTACIDLPLGDQAPAAARHACEPILRNWGLTEPRLLNAVAIVISELVSNAVVHGGGCLELRLTFDDEMVTVSAADGSAVVPRMRDPDDDGGRGLMLIESLAHRWGIENYQGGKRVWVQLRHRPAPIQPRPETQ